MTIKKSKLYEKSYEISLASSFHHLKMGVSRRKQVSFGFTALSESESAQTKEKPF